MSIVCFYVSSGHDTTETLSYAMGLAAKTNQDLQVICGLPDLTASFDHMQLDFGMRSAQPCRRIFWMNKLKWLTQPKLLL